MQEICSEIKVLLSEAVARCKTDSISLSGGLDSSILATFLGRDVTAYVMVAVDFASTDLLNAQIISNQMGMSLKIISSPIEDLLEAAEQTVKILKVFNPIEIRNNIVAYLTMENVKKDGLRSIMTGDGADELFAGYNFFKRLSTPELEKNLERIFRVMHFPSKTISSSLGIKLHTPFLDDTVARWARSVPADLKVRDQDGKKYGKWILRKAFENYLPPSIAWRSKDAMQDGSGTAGLTGFFENMISDYTFVEKSKEYGEKENVLLKSKEALYYYEIYRRYYDFPASLHSSDTKCPICNYSVEQGSHFCRMCGSYPI